MRNNIECKYSSWGKLPRDSLKERPKSGFRWNTPMPVVQDFAQRGNSHARINGNLESGAYLKLAFRCRFTRKLYHGGRKVYSKNIIPGLDQRASPSPTATSQVDHPAFDNASFSQNTEKL